jgi:succinate-semialdehyde dehydrogenase / glutarate-semialdehyde dehydrogenase
MGYATINPATGELVERYETISDAALDEATERAQRCYEEDWRDRSIASRAAIVGAAATIMRDRQEQLAALATLEMGKLRQEAQSEVALSADILDYYARNAEAFLRPQPIAEAPGAMIETAPLGIILAVEPWNFPYYQIARVAGPQLVAGNVLLVKHASNVPQCALAFARIFAEAGAPMGAYMNIFASADQIGRLIVDFRIRGATLTGSESAGASVAEQAGRALKKSVLELGGSDPLIVLEDAPVEATLENALWGRMNTAGQSCTASKRMIVVGRERAASLLADLKERMAALRPGDPADQESTLGPLSSEKVLRELLQQIETATRHGARVVAGGRRIDRAGFYLEPTILTDIDTSNPIYTQELFGPVLSFYVVENEDEAVALANATPFGLGASIFTDDLDRGRALARRIESGMVFINQPVWSAPELPFGGVRNSGYGRELSELGIGEFVNRKLIHVSLPGAPPPSGAG